MEEGKGTLDPSPRMFWGCHPQRRRRRGQSKLYIRDMGGGIVVLSVPLCCSTSSLWISRKGVMRREIHPFIPSTHCTHRQGKEEKVNNIARDQSTLYMYTEEEGACRHKRRPLPPPSGNMQYNRGTMQYAYGENGRRTLELTRRI